MKPWTNGQTDSAHDDDIGRSRKRRVSTRALGAAVVSSVAAGAAFAAAAPGAAANQYHYVPDRTFNPNQFSGGQVQKLTQQKADDSGWVIIWARIGTHTTMSKIVFGGWDYSYFNPAYYYITPFCSNASSKRVIMNAWEYW